MAKATNQLEQDFSKIIEEDILIRRLEKDLEVLKMNDAIRLVKNVYESFEAQEIIDKKVHIGRLNKEIESAKLRREQYIKELSVLLNHIPDSAVKLHYNGTPFLVSFSEDTFIEYEKQ